MNKRFKLVSSVLSMAVVSSLLTFPSLSQAQGTQGKIDLEKEILNAKKHQIHRLLDQQPTTSTKMSAKSVSAQSVTSATYTGTLTTDTIHLYSVNVTTGGTVQVDTNLPEGTYELQNVTTGEFVFPGEEITPGNYMLIIYGFGGESSYNLTLSGFTFTGTTTLPQFNVTSPAEELTRLPKGSKSFTLTGTSSGSTSAGYNVDMGADQSISLGSNGSFSKTVTVLPGYHFIDVWAQNADGNKVLKIRDVISPSVERMAGIDRYATSAEISKRLPVTSDTVVIATGTNFPDALSGGPLAYYEGAPILLTKSGSMPQVIKDEVKRRGAKRAILLGGVDVVSTSVETELRALGVTEIERKEGLDRYETSAAVAKALLDKQDLEFGSHSDTAFIVTGNNYADALAVSSPAGVGGFPILLVKGTTLPAPIKQLIDSKGIKNFYVIGGSDVVSDGIYNQLKTTYGGSVKRLAGLDRYKTALEVAKEFTKDSVETPIVMDSTVFHVAYGGNYPDALSQGPLAAYTGDMGAPLLLTKTGSLDPQVDAFLSDLQPDAFYISGDVSVVSSAVESRLKSIIPE